jgi:hypothetical protein
MRLPWERGWHLPSFARVCGKKHMWCVCGKETRVECFERLRVAGAQYLFKNSTDFEF